MLTKPLAALWLSGSGVFMTLQDMKNVDRFEDKLCRKTVV